MLKVTPEQLQTMSGSVHRTAQDVGGAHAGLRAQITPLLSADWNGAAAAQFASLYDKFNTSAKNLNDALTGIGTLLNAAGHNYQDAEARIAASFRS